MGLEGVHLISRLKNWHPFLRQVSPARPSSLNLLLLLPPIPFLIPGTVYMSAKHVHQLNDSVVQCVVVKNQTKLSNLHFLRKS